MVGAAWAAIKTKGTYLQAQFQRLRARRGARKAIIAVAASMLTAAYHILRASVPYKDLGPAHFNRRDNKHAARRLQRRLEDLGLAIETRPTTAGVSIQVVKAYRPYSCDLAPCTIRNADLSRPGRAALPK